MARPELIAAAAPSEVRSAASDGFPVMEIGWKITDGVLYRPSDAVKCDLICCSSNDKYHSGHAVTLVSECRNLGARGIFLDFEGYVPSPLDISYFGRSQLAFYINGAAPFARSVFRIPFGENWLGSVPEGSAALISRTCRETRIPRIGSPVSRTLSEESLKASIAKYKPTICRSKALCADYFYASDGDETVFTVFDSAESLAEKLSLLHSRGVGECFFIYSEMGFLL